MSYTPRKKKKTKKKKQKRKNKNNDKRKKKLMKELALLIISHLNFGARNNKLIKVMYGQ